MILIEIAKQAARSIWDFVLLGLVPAFVLVINLGVMAAAYTAGACAGLVEALWEIVREAKS